MGKLDKAFKEIGLERTPEQTKVIGEQGGKANRVCISLESLDLIDTDIIFVHKHQHTTVRKTNELPELNQFIDSEPLIRNLRATQTGNIFAVPAYYWFHGRAIRIPLAVNDLEADVLPAITT